MSFMLPKLTTVIQIAKPIPLAPPSQSTRMSTADEDDTDSVPFVNPLKGGKTGVSNPRCVDSRRHVAMAQQETMRKKMAHHSEPKNETHLLSSAPPRTAGKRRKALFLRFFLVGVRSQLRQGSTNPGSPGWPASLARPGALRPGPNRQRTTSKCKSSRKAKVPDEAFVERSAVYLESRVRL